MSLILKRDDRDDYIVLLNGNMVGSIHKVFRPIPEPWRWVVNTRYAEDLGGWSATLEEAKVAFRTAWDDLDMIPVYAMSAKPR